MSNALVPIGDLEKMANVVAASKLFGVTSPDQALALMLVAQAEGLHPATAARDYHVINGRPSLKADAMLARYLVSGGTVEWHEHTDAKVSATFTHPQGGRLTIEWDDARVKQAGLDAQPMHKKYPRQMKRARVISEGIRATNPAVAVGLYTPEEVQDMEPPKPARKEKNMGAAEVVPTESAATQASPPPLHAPSTSATASAADRTIELTALCVEAAIPLADILARTKVKHADEMSATDYEEATAMLKRKAIKMKKAAG